MDEYTHIPDWAGAGVFQAGGSAYLGMTEFQSGTFPGFIETPILDLSANSGKFTIKFRAKSESTSDDVFYIEWYNYEDDEIYEGKEILITNTWQEYTVEFDNAVELTIVYLTSDESPCFIDDIEISQDGGTVALGTPVADDATNLAATSFTANWGAVDGATGYELSVYTKEEGQGEVEVLSADFADCDGAGGNDGAWSSVTGTPAVPDEYTSAGWVFTNVYAGSSSLRVGTGSKQGIVTTPALTDLNGDAILTFRAGAWDSKSELTELALEIAGGGSLDQTSVTMTKGAFSEHTVNITGGTSSTKITFKGSAEKSARFFLDDVVITQDGTSLIPVPVTGSPFAVAGTSHSVTGLDPETTYYYTVVAKNDTETSAKSNEKSATTLEVSGMDFSVVKNNIYVNDKLHVVLDSSNVIEVYTVSGILVNRISGKAGDNEITLPQQGIYVVKAGKTIAKVIK